jgi:dTDP-4-amino-4,6-dideoxygalactose transaminase
VSASASTSAAAVIPLADLRAQYETIRGEIDAAIAQVIGSAQFIHGPQVRAFEDAFAAACGTKHGIGVASGSAALSLALRAVGVARGDEVVTTPFTFAASAECIVHCGARPVFVDVDDQTLTLDPALVGPAVGPRTKAVLPVHLYGRPTDMDPIMSVARSMPHLRVIEDAAQAHLASYKGRVVGSVGHVACFSFFPAKNLGAYGDAGMVVTNDDDVAARVRKLRDHGQPQKYIHEMVGYGERLDTLQAAILGVKLRYLEAWTARRRQIAGRYRDLLAALPLRLPYESPDAGAVHSVFVIRTPDRDRLSVHLGSHGIATAVHYPVPLHLQPAFAEFGYRAGDCPRAERAATEVLSLPMYAELTDAQVDRIAAAIRQFFDRP